MGTLDKFPEQDSQPNSQLGTILSCDQSGRVIEVLRDDLELEGDQAPLQLSDLVDSDSRSKLASFLAELVEQGIAINWELTYLQGDSFLVKSTWGLEARGQIWVAIAEDFEQGWQLLGECFDLRVPEASVNQSSVDEKPLTFTDRSAFQEITRMNNELVSLQREIQQQKRQLELLNEEKDRFLGLAAHDLRNPLAAVLSYTEFLIEDLDHVLNQEQGEFLERIQSSSQYMLSLIDEYLDVSLISLGGMKLERKKISLAELISDAVRLNQILARKKNIEIVNNCKLSEALQVFVDPLKFKQVLLNLLSNAVKFCPPGSRVEVDTVHKEDEFNILIKDNGPGIPQDEVGQLFQLYRRTSVTSSAGEKSSGLGLAIARDIVHMHEGELSVESEPGKGTIFVIIIPAFLE